MAKVYIGIKFKKCTPGNGYPTLRPRYKPDEIELAHSTIKEAREKFRIISEEIKSEKPELIIEGKIHSEAPYLHIQGNPEDVKYALEEIFKKVRPELIGKEGLSKGNRLGFRMAKEVLKVMGGEVESRYWPGYARVSFPEASEPQPQTPEINP